MSDNKLYWRLYLSKDGYVSAVCMQWFDENDYDQDRFIDKEQYKSAEEALGTMLKKLGARIKMEARIEV